MQLRLPPDPNLPLPKLQPMAASTQDYLPNATPVRPLGSFSGRRPAGPEQPGVLTVHVGGDSAPLPDFRGQSKREVLNRCIDIGIHLEASGAGVADIQSPPPGTRIIRGETCTVTLVKANLEKALAAAEAQYAAERADTRMPDSRP